MAGRDRDLQPEEIAMVPKAGWGGKPPRDLDDVGPCGVGRIQPSFLQRFSGMKTFSILFGICILVMTSVRSYLGAQLMMLKRQYDISDSSAKMLVLSGDIAFLVVTLFSSFLARRLHMTRVMAIAVAIAGVGAIVCVLAHPITSGDLKPVPNVTKETQWTIERLQKMAPTCTVNPAMMEKMMEITSGGGAGGGGSAPAGGDSGAPEEMKKPSGGDSVEPAVEEKSFMMPNFTMLAAHPKFDEFTQGARGFGIDLPAVAAMTPEEQIEYVINLPPDVAALLPNLKLMLGDNADSYFYPVTIPTGNEVAPQSVKTQKMVIPDFAKLATHPNFDQFAKAAQGMNIDLRALAKMSLEEQIQYILNLPPDVAKMMPNMRAMLGPNPDDYFISVDVPVPGSEPAEPASGASKSDGGKDSEGGDAAPAGETKTLMMLDFTKLKAHPDFEKFAQMSKGLNIDLKAVAEMSKDEQIKYAASLPPEVLKMLPSMKAMLGDDADSYFYPVEVPVDAMPNSRKKRMTEAELAQDMMHSGILSNMMKTMPPVPDEVIWKVADEMCPFNTNGFVNTDSSSVVAVALISIGMILIGIARAPLAAFGIIYMDSRTDEFQTALYIGIYLFFAGFGEAFGLVLGFMSMSNYVTMEDVGLMTLYDPAWIGAWWFGFTVIGVVALILAPFILMFPNASAQARSLAHNGRKSRKGGASVIKGFFQSLARLVSNRVFLLIVIANALVYLAMEGMVAQLSYYMEQQFNLPPFGLGTVMTMVWIVVAAIGAVVGGVVVSRFRLTPFACLKMVCLITFILTIVHGALIGFGCNQPQVDRAEKKVDGIMAGTCEVNCRDTCVCMDFAYTPICGSDGLTYHSACHAGCGPFINNSYSHCKCIPDDKQTATFGMCEQACQSDIFYVFCLFLLVGAFFVAFRAAPSVLAAYRCVEPRDAPLAIGVNFFLIVIIAGISSSMMYESIADNTCSLRRPKCGPVSDCAMHDIVMFRYHFFGVATILLWISSALYALAVFIGFSPNSVFNRGVHEKEIR